MLHKYCRAGFMGDLMRTFPTCLAVFCLLLSGMANAEEKPPVFKLGKFTVTAIQDSYTDIPYKLFIDSHVENEDRKIPFSLNADSRMTSINTFLIQTPDHNILIDTGLGSGGETIFILKKLGFQPEDIDYILLTHLHPDHIGGLLHRGKAIYPRAVVYVAKAEYNYWFGDDLLSKGTENQRKSVKQARETIMAYGDRVKTFSAEAEIISGITPVPAYGHTPGHTAYLIKSDGKKLLVAGDIIHDAGLQFAEPGVAIVYDSDQLRAIEARRRIFAYAAKNKTPLALMHADMPAIVKVKALDDGSYSFENAVK